MGAETEPLRLVRFRYRKDDGGSLSLVKADGTAIVVPEPFVPLLNMASDGASLAQIAFRLRAVSGVWSRFQGLGRFLDFLCSHGLLENPRLIELSTALRPDYSWRESLAFARLLSFDILRFRSRISPRRWLSLALFTAMVAMIPAILLRLPEHFFQMRDHWSSAQTAWPVIGAFLVAFGLGRSAWALVQLLVRQVMSGAGGRLSVSFDALSVSLATDDASVSASHFLYVAASFLALLALTSPALFETDIASLLNWFPSGFLPFFTLELLLADLSPFRRSALTDGLRAIFVAGERSHRAAGLERRIRTLHIVCCVLWVSAFGLFVAGPLAHFAGFIYRSGWRAGEWIDRLGLAGLVLSQTLFVLSLLDDVISGIGDGGGSDRLSIRRLWSRRKEGNVLAVNGRFSREELERLPFLRQMDASARSALLDRGTVVDFGAGDAVCRQNDRDRTLYILLQGQLKVSRRTSAGRRRAVAFLEPGAVFGEVAFFFGDRRTADVSAIEPARLLAIAHDERLANMDRNRSEELQLRIWFLQSLVASPFFRQLPADAMDALLFAGAKRRFKGGETVIAEGETADACYFIIQGQATVVQNFRPINRLKAGDAFGEIALLKPELLRTASVIADTEMLVVRVDGERFWILLCEHLPLAIEFEKMAETRLREDAKRN